MEEDPDDLTALHYQIMFPPHEPCHRQREYELEQHLALMDEPATSGPAASMDLGDLGNLTIEHLSGYDDLREAQKYMLPDEERYPKEDMLEIGIEASDLGSLLQQFEQKEAAFTTTDPDGVSEPQQTSSVAKKMPGPKNVTKKIVPVKRKSTILMEPLAMPTKRLRDKEPAERASVSLPGSRTSSPLTVQPQGMSVICSADQGFDYLIMDHDYCNVQDTKLTTLDPSGPVNTASQLAAEQRKALYKQKYKIRKKGKTKGRVVGGHYSEKALAEGLVSETDKPAFINKLPDYIHPMPEVSLTNSVKNVKGKHLKQGVVPMPQPLLEKEAPPKGQKPEFFDKIPDYFIGKHMYQEISKVEEAERQALEEEMTKLKEKQAEMDLLHEKSKLEVSKDNEGAATHLEAHRHRPRHHHHHHHRKVHAHGQIRNSSVKDAPVSNGGQVIDASEVDCQQPRDVELQQTSNQETNSDRQTVRNKETKHLHARRSRKSSYSERFSRSRSRSRSYSSYSSSSSGSSFRSRSYSSSSVDSRYSRSRHRGRSYISRSRSRSYSRSRSRSRSHSYRRRRRRYSTYSSASHSSSSISRSRSRSHSRSRQWRPRGRTRSYSRSRSRSRSRSYSGDSSMRRRRGTSHRESRRRTQSRSERRHRRSTSIEQSEERREKRLEEQLEQWKDRRVVYIGRIPYGTTRAVIRRRFEKFGEIERITLHFRDEGDNYAFVTYNFKCDAYAAVEGANKDPDEPVYDICFGGRRQFCKSSYEDLDSMAQEEDAFDYGYKQPCSSSSGKAETDFDRLLQDAMKKLKR